MTGHFDMYDESFREVLRDDSVLERLASPAVWAEGPVWLPERDAVVFSDVKGNRMHIWSEQDGVSLFREASNYNNGNYLDRQGRIVGCEHGRRCISRTEKDGKVTVLVDKYDGKRLNSPNDLVVKSDGTIWFTDPPCGILGDEEGFKSESQVIGCHIYRFDPESGDLSIATLDVERPNGLAFSPDEKLLYAADMFIVEFPAKGRRQLNVYDVVDGVQVVLPDGNIVGKIRVPERVSNCTFGGRDEDVLYITAATSLYRIRLAARGMQYSHLL